jgi:hypothetical protein
MLPHLRGSIALVLLADKLMSAPGSHSSCLYFPNMPGSQATNYIQNPSNRPNSLRYTAAYNSVDKFAFASQVLSIHLLIVGFQAAEHIVEIIGRVFDLVTVRRQGFFLIFAGFS